MLFNSNYLLLLVNNKTKLSPWPSRRDDETRYEWTRVDPSEYVDDSRPTNWHQSSRTTVVTPLSREKVTWREYKEVVWPFPHKSTVPVLRCFLSSLRLCVKSEDERSQGDFRVTRAVHRLNLILTPPVMVSRTLSFRTPYLLI